MEQKNCTLVEMARTMLNEHRTPKRFCADAISTVYYISNRIFPRSILHLSIALDASHLSLILGLLVASALS
jgi:hypothetical protein